MSRRSNRATDPAKRAEALRLADEHGAAEASRRTGIPAATIRAWRSRQAKAAEPAKAGAELDEVERLEKWVAAEESAAAGAMGAANAARHAGKAGDAQRYATVHGIHLDKLERLRFQLHAAREHRVRLSEAQAQQLADVIRELLGALGVPMKGPGVRAVVRLVLTERQQPTHDCDDVKAARREVWRALAAEAEAQGLVEHRPALPAGEDEGPRGLPAPDDDDGDSAREGAGGDEMVGPKRVVRAFRERRNRRSQRRTNGDEPEVVEPDEVLPPKRSGQGGVEDAVRAAREPEDRQADLHWRDDVWGRQS